MSSSQPGLMSPGGDLAAAGAPGGAPVMFAHPCPLVNAREVSVFSPKMWRGTPSGHYFRGGGNRSGGMYGAPGWDQCEVNEVL